MSTGRSSHRIAARRSPARTGLSLAAILGITLLAACTGQDAEPASNPATPSLSATSTPTPTATDDTGYGIPVGGSPLSGRAGGADQPILAVKIDNTKAAQPFAGLTAADLVYVEEVEWELTRLVALFSTELPDVIGPVRSARISDIDILAPFGRIAFAYSGAQSKLLPELARATFIDVSGTTGGTGWFDAADRPSPTNHMIDVSTLMTRAPDAATADDIGLVFSEDPPAGGQSVTSISVDYGASTVSFRWDASAGGYIVSMDDVVARTVEGDPLVAATVAVQQVRQTDSGYGDKFGGVTPLIETVGSGTALVLRDGRMWSTRWDRLDDLSGTRFTLADGSPMPFAIGQEWIVLLDETLTPTIG